MVFNKGKETGCLDSIGINKVYKRQNQMSDSNDLEPTQVLKYLFDLELEQDVNPNTKPSPLSTVLNKTCAIADIKCGGCVYGNPCKDCGTVGYLRENLPILCGYSFDVNYEDYVMKFSHVEFDAESNVTGEIKISVPGEAFNHASCNTYFTNTFKYTQTEKVVILDYVITFKMSDKLIQLNIIPHVVV